MKEIIAIPQDDGPVHIDFSQIPAIEMQLLSATFPDAVQRFYENPDNICRFEEWQRTREKDASNG